MKNIVRINRQITAPELRVIGSDGGNLGLLSRDSAIAQAEKLDLDLIEISPTAKPPVAKIMDYGKYQYLERQKQKQAKAGSHATETKSIQIKIGTGDHDLNLKAIKTGKFIKEGHRVKVELFLPGRSKYFEKDFLNERLERLLKLIPEDYSIAEPPKKNPKGIYLIVEKGKAKGKSDTN